MGLLRIWRINRFYILNFLSALILFKSVLTKTDVYNIYFGKLNMTTAFTIIFSVGFVLLDVLFLTDSMIYYLVPSNEIRVRKADLTSVLLRITLMDIVFIAIRSLIILNITGSDLRYEVIINLTVTIATFMAGNVVLNKLTVDKRILIITLLIIVIRLI